MGKGSFGFVYKAVDPRTGEVFAIKRTKKDTKHLGREVEMLMQLRGCENVVNLKDVYYIERDNQPKENINPQS